MKTSVKTSLTVLSIIKNHGDDFGDLVGGFNPSEKYEFVNRDDNRNPIFMGKSNSWQPVTTNQWPLRCAFRIQSPGSTSHDVAASAPSEAVCCRALRRAWGAIPRKKTTRFAMGDPAWPEKRRWLRLWKYGEPHTNHGVVEDGGIPKNVYCGFHRSNRYAIPNFIDYRL